MGVSGCHSWYYTCDRKDAGNEHQTWWKQPLLTAQSLKLLTSGLLGTDACQ